MRNTRFLFLGKQYFSTLWPASNTQSILQPDEQLTKALPVDFLWSVPDANGAGAGYPSTQIVMPLVTPLRLRESFKKKRLLAYKALPRSSASVIPSSYENPMGGSGGYG